MNVIRIVILVVLGVYFTACTKFGSGEELSKTSLSQFSSDALLVQSDAEAQAPPENRGNGKNPIKNKDDNENGNSGSSDKDFSCNPEKVEDIVLNAKRLYFRVADDIIISVAENLGEVSLEDLSEGIEFTAPEDIESDMGVLELEMSGHSLASSDGEDMNLAPINGNNMRIKIVLKGSQSFSRDNEYLLKTDLDLDTDLKRTNRGCLLIPTLFEQ